MLYKMFIYEWNVNSIDARIISGCVRLSLKSQNVGPALVWPQQKGIEKPNLYFHLLLVDKSDTHLSLLQYNMTITW